jgi:glycine cleavage system regulatory protein
LFENTLLETRYGKTVMTENSAFLILTVIGDDRPGLVGEVAAVISAHQGNWLEASMSHLAGQFAGIVKVAIPSARSASLQAALSNLAGFKIHCETSAERPAKAERRLSLSLVGHDRIGIVSEVTQTLARHAVNIEKIETHTASAPMSAGTLFYAEVSLAAAASLDVRALQADLERISNDLMVDISLGEAIRG